MRVFLAGSLDSVHRVQTGSNIAKYQSILWLYGYRKQYPVGMSNQNKNVVHGMFSMDEKEFEAYHVWLESGAEIQDPSDHLKQLNSPKAMETSGHQQLQIGLGGVVVALGLFLFLGSGAQLILIIPPLCIAAIIAGYGLSEMVTSRSRRLSSQSDMWRLESSMGFLWRFEQFLTDWDNNLPREVEETLRPICMSSKNKSILEAKDHATLRAYWFWVGQLRGRMDVVSETELP